MTRARDLSNLIGSGNYTSTTFTATAGQTVFTIAHTQGFIQVFMNGLLLDETTDYTSNGTAVTLTDEATAGDELEVVKYNTFSVGDAITQTDADTRYVNASGDTMTGNLGIGDGNPTNHYGEEFRLVLREDQTSPTQMCITNATVGTGAKTQYKMIGGTGNSFAGWVLDDNNGSPYSDLSFGNAVNHLQIGLGGQERLRIDSAGRVTMPYQPSFLAYDLTGGTVSQTGIIPCDTTSYNVGNHYNTSTYKFTAPVAGMYQFGWNHYTSNWNESARRTFLKVNDTIVMQTGNYGNGIPISMTIKLEANDQVYLSGSTNYPTRYYAAYGHNAFTGILLG